MKKLIALILVVFMTLTVVGCSDENANSSANSESNQSNTTEALGNSNKQPLNNNESSNNSITTPTNDTVKCEIEVIDGQHRIIPIANYVSSNTGSGLVSADVSFKSIDKFVNTIKSGNFTRVQYSTMVDCFKKDESGRIKICNPNKIYEPVTPKEYSVKSVSWSGEDYAYSYNNASGCNGWIYFYTKESFESRSEYVWKRDGRGFELDKTKKYPDYTEISFTTGIADFKLKRYKLETNIATYEKDLTKTEIYVEEEYILRSESPNFTASSEIPNQITMLIQNEDLQYEVEIRGIKSPVTPEWLMQFGLKPRS